MKICAVISEYNPFHNGHAYQLARIKELSGCDRILCIMSGNFTQRGDIAVFDKYTRARHAVMGGADAVIELPVPFAVSPAELFAKGAVHILSSIPAVKVLAFGCENGTADPFLTAAKASLREDREFKAALKEAMKDGTSYVRAHTEVLFRLNKEVDRSLFTSPNNILGVEYCRAILTQKADMVPLPIVRVGGGDKDTDILKNYSSATALRGILGESTLRARRALKRNMPAFVCADAENFRPIPYETAVMCALISAKREELALAPDCSEGLENCLLSMVRSNPVYGTLLDKVVSKRYTRARIKRILLQNFLGIGLRDVRGYIDAPLYCRTLAVKSGDKELLKTLAEGRFPLIVRKSDFPLLKKEALACFTADMHANALYSTLSGRPLGDYETLFIE